MTDDDFLSLLAEQHNAFLNLCAKIAASENAACELDRAAKRYEAIDQELKLQQMLRNLAADRKVWPVIPEVRVVKIEMVEI